MNKEKELQLRKIISSAVLSRCEERRLHEMALELEKFLDNQLHYRYLHYILSVPTSKEIFDIEWDTKEELMIISRNIRSSLWSTYAVEYLLECMDNIIDCWEIKIFE